MANMDCHSGHAAFEVQDIAAMEERLVFFGIEYTKAVVPGTEAAQLFFYDPGKPFCTYNSHVLDTQCGAHMAWAHEHC